MKKGIIPENKRTESRRGTHSHPRPARGPQRGRSRPRPRRRARCPGGGRRPRGGRPGRCGGRTRRRGRHGHRRACGDQHGRRPAGPARAREERHRHPHQGHPARHPRHLDGRRRVGSPARRGPARRAPGADSIYAGQPATADGTAEGREANADPGREPDPAVAAEVAQYVAAIAQAAGEASKALAAGDLEAALAALEAVRDQAAQGRRVIKAAASGRRAPATRPGALRDLVEDHLRTFPGTAFTPHQIGKVLTRSAGAVANTLDKLTALGTAQLACDKPRRYRLASAPGDAGDPGTGAAPPSAA
jgi:hypothetical protein